MFTTLNPAAPSISERLVRIILGMCQAVAARGGRQPVNTPLIVLTWTRLRRTATRFEALMALLRAGRRPREPSGIARTRTPGPRRPSRPNRLPNSFAWLLRLAPETAAYGSQLQHLLEDPATIALLKQAPQAGRILRPLCRMLGVAPGPATLPPSRPTAARQTPERPPPPSSTETPSLAEHPPSEPLLPDRCGGQTAPI